MNAHLPAPATAAARRGVAEARRHWQRGLDHLKDQSWSLAVAAFERATAADPRDPLYWVNLAQAWRRSGQAERAIDVLERALALDPQHELALRMLGDVQMQLHDHAAAVATFERLEASGVLEPEALLQHGCALQWLGATRLAAKVLLKALELKPTLVQGHALLADALREQGLKREALECMQTVLALEPDNLFVQALLAYERRHILEWQHLDTDVAAIERILERKTETDPAVTAAFSLLSLPLPPELQLKCVQMEARAVSQGQAPLPLVAPAARKGHKPRIGLLSFDFREHPVSQLLVEVLERWDHGAAELVLYSCSRDDGSALRQRMVALADRFVDVNGMTDRQAAERIRADGIDLLVDLMGHTRGHRMGILARKPAPVQAAYLGFPASTGLATMDYIVGDPLVTPPELAHLYTEKLAQMPLTMQPNGQGRPLPQPASRAEVGLPEDAFVMCAFNNPYKILPDAFDVWCDVMRRVPKAVLWLKNYNAQLQDNARREALARGVDPARLYFAPLADYGTYFSRFALADVFVDTWPYGAHTTAADALWAGVPVLTCYGNGYASRVAASALNACGLAELAMATPEDYHLALLALASEPGLVQHYQQHLRTQRLQLPLFDTPRYAGELQALFLRMVARWRDGLAPDHLLADAEPADAPAVNHGESAPVAHA